MRNGSDFISKTDKKILDLIKDLDNFKEKRDYKSTLNCINAAKNLLNSKLTKIQYAQIYYSIATAYSDAIDFGITMINNEKREEYLELAIYYYTCASDEIDVISDNTNGLFQQVFTNAGNIYNSVGRFLKAIELYDKASIRYGEHPMALANKAYCAYISSTYLYSGDNNNFYLHFSYNVIEHLLLNEKCKECLDFHDATKYFTEIKSNISSFFPVDLLDQPAPYGDYDYGKTKKESTFRKWITLNHLFLNELNEITLNPIASTDYLHLPSMIFAIGDDKWKLLYGLFNQIKQEYTSARYMFYDGIQLRKSVQLPDREVLLIEIDYNVVSHADYCIRTAFKTAYSILDRIFYFINIYYDLGIKSKDVTFRSIWQNENKEYQYKNTLEPKREKNVMLNALYWLSKDIHEDNYKSTKKKSTGLAKLRNKLEHRCVASILTNFELNDDILNDDNIFSISTNDLYNQTMDILKLAREAVFYLSFAVHIEEKGKKSEYEKAGLKICNLQTRVMPDIAK